nr:MAG TPA: hypothetical protein [Caudoviricetes sp.]
MLYDYQRLTRYYTIYRTFKRWLPDDFTTILRLLATTISAGTLQLLLTSISYRAKARKKMRRKPPMVPRRRVEGAPLTRCQTFSRRVNSCTGCKPDALTRCRCHGLFYAALSGMDS